jgi:hypothetical protein
LRTKGGSTASHALRTVGTPTILTDDGYDKAVDTAPGHVEEVRKLVVDQLTKAQLKQMSAIGRRVLEGIASDATCR